MTDSEVCCGFGSTFCVKHGDISTVIVEKKTTAVDESRADLLLAGDLGCLMNRAGILKRQGSAILTRHVAKVPAGSLNGPPISKKQDVSCS
ncbi:MAG: (Fe-S)-binding protein [Pseudomonadota bacterium]